MHYHVAQSHHQPKQAISRLRELEDQEEVKEGSEGMISSSHGAEVYCTGVGFAPTNHREKREMAVKKINAVRTFWLPPPPVKVPSLNQSNDLKMLHVFFTSIQGPIFYMERRQMTNWGKPPMLASNFSEIKQ